MANSTTAHDATKESADSACRSDVFAVLLEAAVPELLEPQEIPAEISALRPDLEPMKDEEFSVLNWSHIPRLKAKWHGGVKHTTFYSKLQGSNKTTYLVLWQCCLSCSGGGKVFLGFNLDTGSSVAVKIVHATDTEIAKRIEQFKIRMQVKYEDVFALKLKDSPATALVMQCVDNALSDLLPLWHPSQRFANGEERFATDKHVVWIQHIASQVLQAAREAFAVLQVLPAEELASYCIRPQRILVDAAGLVKLQGVGLVGKDSDADRFLGVSDILECSGLQGRLSFSVGKTLEAMVLCREDGEDDGLLAAFQQKQPHHGHLLVDLIRSLTHEPDSQLALSTAQNNPFFWSTRKCMAFIVDVAATLDEEDVEHRWQDVFEHLNATCDKWLRQLRQSDITLDVCVLRYDGEDWWTLFTAEDKKKLPQKAYKDLSWETLLDLALDVFRMEDNDAQRIFLQRVPFLTSAIWKHVLSCHHGHFPLYL